MAGKKYDDYYVDMLPEVKESKVSIEELYDLYYESNINLNPPYQRDPVWTDKRESELMWTVMQRKYVPPLVFNVNDIGSTSAEESNKPRNCIDGKQRLLAILHFMEGKVGVKSGDGNPRKWFFQQRTVDGVEKKVKGRQILSEKWKNTFKAFKFHVVEYENLTTQEERWIFQALQQGVSLRPAEILYAIISHRNDFCKELYDDYYNPLLAKVCNMDKKSGFGTISTLFSAVNSYENITGEEIPRLRTARPCETWMAQQTEPVEIEERQKMEAILDRFAELVLEDPPKDGKENIPTSAFSADPCYFKATLHSAPTFSPVEFVGTGLLIHEHPSRENNLLLEDIKAMRKYARQTHQDLRMNSKVFKSLWDFIKEEMAKRLAGDYSGDIPDNPDGPDDNEDTASNHDHHSEEDTTKEGDGDTKSTVVDTSMNEESDVTVKAHPSTMDASMKDASDLTFNPSISDASMPDATTGQPESVVDDSMPDASDESTILGPNDSMSGVSDAPFVEVQSEEEDESTILGPSDSMSGVSDAPFTEYPEEDTEHPAEDTEHPSEDTEHPAEDTEHPAEDTEHPEEDTEHPAEDTEHPEEDTEHETENTEHPAEDTRYPAEDDESIWSNLSTGTLGGSAFPQSTGLFPVRQVAVDDDELTGDMGELSVNDTTAGDTEDME